MFQLTGLQRISIARLCLIQFGKRSPINLRRLLLVPKQVNPKAIALLLNGYCNLIELPNQYRNGFGSLDELRSDIIELADLLVGIQSEGFHGACWGYNFDWQSRRSFLFPAYTPTVVVTSFCASALIRAAEVTGEDKYLEVALSSAKFVMKDLKQTKFNDGILLSYSPLSGNDTVFNASLLGAKLLSLCDNVAPNESYKDLALKICHAVCKCQEDDGSWIYGLNSNQKWVDSFHTGYNLESLTICSRNFSNNGFDDFIQKGLDFYLANFFTADGRSKYYHNKIYPIDIHSPAQLWITLSSMGRFKEYLSLCNSVLLWTIENMQSKKGFFYYQKRPVFILSNFLHEME